jgi:hypothetical protein
MLNIIESNKTVKNSIELKDQLKLKNLIIKEILNL